MHISVHKRLQFDRPVRTSAEGHNHPQPTLVPTRKTMYTDSLFACTRHMCPNVAWTYRTVAPWHHCALHIGTLQHSECSESPIHNHTTQHHTTPHHIALQIASHKITQGTTSPRIALHTTPHQTTDHVHTTTMRSRRRHSTRRCRLHRRATLMNQVTKHAPCRCVLSGGRRLRGGGGERWRWGMARCSTARCADR